MRHILFGLLAATALAAPAFSQDAARMDKAASAEADRNGFMGAILVAQDGKILFDKGYGSANLEWKIPNDGETRFRLGSLTKQFTAASILLLQERGKLRLDTPIKTYLPDAPAAWDKMTVFHLLTHTAGLTEAEDVDTFGPTREDRVRATGSSSGGRTQASAAKGPALSPAWTNFSSLYRNPRKCLLLRED